jgi:hypothetical protein
MRLRIERLEERIALYGDHIGEYEPNGSIEQANEIAELEHVQRQGTLTGAVDTDFLAFDLVQGLQASISAVEAPFFSEQSSVEVHAGASYSRWNASLQKRESNSFSEHDIDKQTLTISRLVASGYAEILDGPPNANSRVTADSTWLDQTKGSLHFSADLSGQQYETDGRASYGSASGSASWRYSFFSPRSGEVTFDYSLLGGASIWIQATTNSEWISSGRLDSSQGSRAFSLGVGYSSFVIHFNTGGSVEDSQLGATIDWDFIVSSAPIQFDLLKPDGSVYAADIGNFVDFEADVSGRWFLQAHQSSEQDVHYHIDFERELVGRLNAAWLVHGFNPEFLTETGQTDFITPWRTTFKKAVVEQLSNSERDEYAYVNNLEWDSSSDWGRAFVAYTLKEALNAYSIAQNSIPVPSSLLTKIFTNTAINFLN